MVSGRALAAAIVSGCCISSAFAADPAKPSLLVVPMFGDGVTLMVPAGWNRVHQERTAQQAVLEFVPAGQSVKDWSEMLTVQAIKGPPAEVTPMGFLEQVVVGVRRVCPEHAVAITLGDLKVGERPAHAAIIGCGAMPAGTAGAKAGQGEVAFYVAVRGVSDMVVVHRAVRGKAFDRRQPPITAPVAAAMRAALEPLTVCGLSEPPARCGPTAKR